MEEKLYKVTVTHICRKNKKGHFVVLDGFKSEMHVEEVHAQNQDQYKKDRVLRGHSGLNSKFEIGIHIFDDAPNFEEC